MPQGLHPERSGAGAAEPGERGRREILQPQLQVQDVTVTVPGVVPQPQLLQVAQAVQGPGGDGGQAVVVQVQDAGQAGQGGQGAQPPRAAVHPCPPRLPQGPAAARGWTVLPQHRGEQQGTAQHGQQLHLQLQKQQVTFISMVLQHYFSPRFRFLE